MTIKTFPTSSDGKSFSKWDLTTVLQRYDSPERLSPFEIVPLPLDTDNHKMLMTRLGWKEKVYSPINIGLEAERNEYISEFLGVVVLANTSGTCTLRIRREYLLKSSIGKGPADFFIHTIQPKRQLPVLVVVEAKQSRMDQGQAQCMLEMEAAFLKLPNQCRHIYGVVTTAERWMFLRFDGSEFCQFTPEFLILDVSTHEEQIRLCSEFLNRLVHEQVSQLTE